MTYEIPKRLKEESKIYYNPDIYIKDIVTAIVMAGAFFLCSSFVHAYFIIPYFIFAVLLIIYLVQKAKANPGKRNWEAILYLIQKDHTTYHSLNPTIHIWRSEDENPY